MALSVIEPRYLCDDFGEENDELPEPDPKSYQLTNGGDFIAFANEGRVCEMGIIVDILCRPESLQILKLTIFVGYE